MCMHATRNPLSKIPCSFKQAGSTYLPACPQLCTDAVPNPALKLGFTWVGHTPPEPVSTHNIGGFLNWNATSLRLEEDAVQQRQELEGAKENKHAILHHLLG